MRDTSTLLLDMIERLLQENGVEHLNACRLSSEITLLFCEAGFRKLAAPEGQVLAAIYREYVTTYP